DRAVPAAAWTVAGNMSRMNELSHDDRRYELDRQSGEFRVGLYAPERDSHWRLPLPPIAAPEKSPAS
ncbi:MAG: hypothetical protein ACNA7J_05360, partial [Wenzhouxiangella sp.]